MNGAEKQREIFRRAEVVRGEVRKLRDKDPQLTHVQAWRKLLATKPHLFEDVGARASSENSATIQQGMQLIRAQIASDIRQAVNEVQQGQPDLSFAEAWELAKKENPSLFAGAARIEAGDWGSGYGKPPRYVDTGPKKVAARKPIEDDREVYIVYASDGTVAGLELS